MRRAAAGMPTSCSSSIARLRAARVVQVQMRADRLDELAADRVERIERRERILEDRADPAAADLAHRVVWQLVDAPAVEPDLARGDASRRLEQADDRRAGQRLAGAGLADDAQHLAGRDVRTTRRRPRSACRAAWGTRRAGRARRAAARRYAPARRRGCDVRLATLAAAVFGLTPSPHLAALPLRCPPGSGVRGLGRPVAAQFAASD